MRCPWSMTHRQMIGSESRCDWIGSEPRCDWIGSEPRCDCIGSDIYHADIWVRKVSEGMSTAVAAGEWRNGVDEQIRRLKHKPSPAAEMMITAIVQCFVDWLNLGLQPQTTAQWMLPFRILHTLLYQFAMSEFGVDNAAVVVSG